MMISLQTLILWVGSFLSFFVGLTFYLYLFHYRDYYEGPKSNVIYMSWNEYRKYYKVFPDNFYWGHNSIIYADTLLDELFYRYSEDKHFLLVPIKFRYLTGFIPLLFVNLHLYFNRNTSKHKKKRIVETEAKLNMILDMQKMINKEYDVIMDELSAAHIPSSEESMNTEKMQEVAVV